MHAFIQKDLESIQDIHFTRCMLPGDGKTLLIFILFAKIKYKIVYNLQ